MLRLDSHAVYAIVILVLAVRVMVVVLILSAGVVAAHTAWLSSLNSNCATAGPLGGATVGLQLLLLMWLQTQNSFQNSV